MDRVIELIVESGGERVDKWIADHAAELSRAQVQRLIEAGQVTVGGVMPKPSYRLSAGETVVVHVPPPEPVELTPEPIPLDVIYEDHDLIVVNKPAGLVVHPAAGHAHGTLVHAILAHCPDLAGVGGALRPGIVHRLDRDTSGLIVIAKNDAAQLTLQRQFKSRTVEKVYLALVEGRPSPPQGRIDAPIGRDPRQRRRMAVVAQGGRAAQTDYRVIETLGDYTLVEIRPRTGRTHQVRVHLASLGHPLAGDRVYGRRRQSIPLDRQFLHAWRLTFALPSGGERRTFTAPLPPDLQAVLHHLGRRPGLA
jgi:23S rRNA pseudouridine1911/1915/1917 synthase